MTAPDPISRTVTVHYQRLEPERGLSIYHEPLLLDDGVRVQTLAVIPPAERERVSAGLWRAGLLPPGLRLGAMRKNYFYGESFDVLEFLDEQGRLAGYYSDIVTPLTVRDGIYHLVDLFLDVWITPEGQYHELDWDEFLAAAEHGLISAEQQHLARTTLQRLRAEFAAGLFPGRYLA